MHSAKIQAHTTNFRQRDFEQGDRQIPPPDIEPGCRANKK
jgi:hypothetical protein